MGFDPNYTWLIALAALWVLPWKGYALWHAARLGHLKWFIALLVLNTLAILEIVYIFAVARPALREKESGTGSESAS